MRLKNPQRSPSSADIVRPVKSSSAARPWPMTRGSIAQAPMSQPARPTRVKRKAVLAAGVRDAQVGEERDHRAGADADAVDGGDDRLRTGAHRLDRSPVMRVKASSPFMSRVSSGPMMSWTSPPDEKLPPFERDDDRLDVVGRGQRPEAVAKLGVRVERQRVLPLGPRERDDGDAAVDPPVEVRGLKISHG